MIDDTTVDDSVNMTKDNDGAEFQICEDIPLENVVSESVMSVINGSGESCSKTLYSANKKNSDSSYPILNTLLLTNTHDLQDNTLAKNQFEVAGTNETDLVIFPNNLDVPKEYLPTYVALKDWGQYLKTNPCYCDTCKILFPTVNCLDSHKMSAHSFLVAFTNRKEDTDSESDIEVDKVSGSTISSDSHPNSVKIIDINNSETNSRLRKRKLSDRVEENLSSSGSLLNVSTKGTADGKITGERCFHCDQVFIDSSALIKHLYDQVDSLHLSKVKDTAINCVFKCKICEETFSNEIIAKFHSRFMHSELSKNVIEKCVVKAENDVKIGKDIRENKEKTVKINKTNMIKTVKVEDENSLSARFSMKKRNYEFTFMKTVVVKNPPVPINVLFKCSNCEMHLITGQSAYNHSTKCNGKNRQYECQKCKRKFRPCDEVMHDLQHFVTKSFKAYVYRSNLTKRLLCRCPKCNICFSERLFWQHLMRPCIKKFIHCNKCNLNINKETYTNTGHKDCGDNVIVDYIDDIIQPKVKSVSSKSGDKNMYRLWCCEECQMCGRSDSRTHNCNLKYKSCCYQCGTYFSPKGILTHKSLHLEQSLNLHNFLFYSTLKRKFIEPLMPNYKICSACDMYYLKWHKMCPEVFRTCEVCSKKFEVDHYEVHKKFHNYDLQKLINETIYKGGYVGFKSSSYMFQCVKCKCFVHNYDQAVYHAKKHIKRISQQKIYCKKCDKTFDAITFNVHNHNFEKCSIILKFDYTKFFSDEWFDVFDCLDQVEIGIILRDCLFKDTRSFDLTLVQKGHSDKTLYVCSSCNIVVEKVALEKHMSNKMYCWNHMNYKCEMCDLYFYSPGVLDAHKTLHTNGVRKEDFCIISVANIDIAATAVLDKSTIGKANTSCLNFVPQKKSSDEKNVWMKKRIAGLNISEIDMKVDQEDQSIDNSDLTVSEKGNDDNGTKDLILYRCMDCAVCIISCVYYENHYCKTKYMRFCEKCKQFYHKANWLKHNLLMHFDNENVEFILKDFRTKLNKIGRPQRYIVKITNMVYDKRGVNRKDVGFKAKSPKGKETTKMLKDKLSQDGVSDTNDEEIDTVYQRDSKCVKKNPPKNETVKDLTLYKCSNCMTCIIRPANTDRHMCSIEIYKRFCEYCQQWFSIGNWERHKTIHNSTAKVNILVKYFKPKKIVYAKRTIKMITMKENEQTKTCDQIPKAECLPVVNDTNGNNQPNEDNKRINIKNKKDSRTIFKCSNCNVCLLSSRYEADHVCYKARTVITCSICTHTYSSNSYYAHKKSFCKGNKINLIVEYFKSPKTSITNNKYKTMFIPNTKMIEEKVTKHKDEESCTENNNNNKKTVKNNASVNNKIDVVLYKCLYCQICIRSTRWNCHRCVPDNFRRYCYICKQLFPMQSFFKHRKWHQRTKNINVTIKNFKPTKQYYSSNFKNIGGNYKKLKNKKVYVTNNSKKMLVARNISNNVRKNKLNELKRTKIIKSLKPSTATSSVSADFDKESQSIDNKKPKIKSTKSYSDDEDYEPTRKSQKATKLASGISDSKELNNCSLYLCAKCNVHFLQHMSRRSHIYKRHYFKGKYGFDYCSYCKLRFCNPSLKKHECPLKFKHGYIKIIDLKDKVIRVIRRDDDDDLPINETDPLEDSRPNEVVELGVDSCEDTNSQISNSSIECINENRTNGLESFIQSNRFSKALNNNEKDLTDNGNAEISEIPNTLEKVNAKNMNSYEDIIDLNSDSNSMDSVENTNSKQTDNGDLEFVDINKCDENSANAEANHGLNTININLNKTNELKNTKVTNSTNTTLNKAPEFSKTIERLEQNSKKSINEKSIENNADNLSNINKSSNTGTVDELSDSLLNPTVVQCENKLFSCGSCEVYFIKAQCCQSHLKNHTKLDPRFYIQCKLCMLQFLVLDLYIHMVTHHDGGFKFENLVIEEFMPNEIQPRIYELKDKLQSVIISTTSAECD